MNKLIGVMTTIFEPTQKTQRIIETFNNNDIPFIVIGDKKGPGRFDDSALFYPLVDQQELKFNLSEKLPMNHYARKNIGYLLAFLKNAQCIYEIDDDTFPNSTWEPRQQSCRVKSAESASWLNIYKHFTNEPIWPRGFLLDKITQPISPLQNNLKEIQAPIQQGLINTNPDVDAIWRLALNRDIIFNNNDSVAISPYCWCPFNSQSTWWWPVAYPLLYLPSFCSFRMTDIWRSFIAQRCLWELGFGIVFHAPEAEQERNSHNLLKDFEDEIPGYLENKKLTELLMSLSLSKQKEDICDNLYKCYELLVDNSLFSARELVLVKSWIKDYRSITNQTANQQYC